MNKDTEGTRHREILHNITDAIFMKDNEFKTTFNNGDVETYKGIIIRIFLPREAANHTYSIRYLPID